MAKMTWTKTQTIENYGERVMMVYFSTHISYPTLSTVIYLDKFDP